MSATISSIVRWAARVSALLLAAGLVVFAVGEPSDSLRIIVFREWVGMAFLFGAAAAMVCAWRWEFPAALISQCALAAFAAVAHMHRYGILIIASIPNLLFLLDWKLRHTHASPVVKPG